MLWHLNRNLCVITKTMSTTMAAELFKILAPAGATFDPNSHPFSSLIRPKYEAGSKLSPEHTSPLAYFFPMSAEISARSVSLLDPTLCALREARLEIHSARICPPRGPLVVTTNHVAVLGATGWKERGPALELYSRDTAGPMEGKDVETGLADVAFEMVADDNMLWVGCQDGGDGRFKAFQLGPGAPVLRHTLYGTSLHGPIAVVGDRVLRAGAGKVGVWEQSRLQVHGDESEHIGGEIREFDTSMDEDDVEDTAERSEGQPPHMVMQLEERMKPRSFSRHPSATNQVLACDDVNYSFRAINMNTGKIAQ
jgi:hypothetical protein